MYYYLADEGEYETYANKKTCLLDLYNNRENLRIQVKLSLCFVLWAAVNTSVLKANIKKKYLDSF